MARVKTTRPTALEAYHSMLKRRLARLLQMCDDYKTDLNPLGLRLLDRAVWATQQDLDRVLRGEVAADGAAPR